MLWAVALLFALHDGEEAIAIGVLLPALRAEAPGFATPLLAAMSLPAYLAALAAWTVLVFAAAAWAVHRRTPSAVRLVVVCQATAALNVVAHVAAAVMLGRYVPGLVTALLCNLPFSVWFFRTAVRERWLPPRALLAAVPAALALHGPGLLALLAAARWLSGAGR